MCNKSGLLFVAGRVGTQDIEGQTVLEVGSMDVNGSARPHLEALRPSKYVGVDIMSGPGVDEICAVEDLVARFGADSFDVVVSTEMIEHVRDWRGAFDQMKRVLRPGGLLVLTTRSIGFKIHGYPYDFWRYQPEDIRFILRDFTDLLVEEDELAPGVFAIARKPITWQPVNLSTIALHSVVTRGRVIDVTSRQATVFKMLYRAHQAYRRAVPESVRSRVKRLVVRHRAPPSLSV